MVNPSRIVVLLIDDQPFVAEAVRRAFEGHPDLELHYCSDPNLALDTATALSPTIILQDLVMPDIDGLTLVRFFRANPVTKDVPIIVLSAEEDPYIKAEAFEAEANDYLVKLPNQVELLARIRHHSRGYINLIERNEAHAALSESQRHLAEEMAVAARYVESLLPRKLRGPVNTDWRFVPSASLGGDAFGYQWIDDDHFAFYLLDVCGHGVGAALLSVSVLNVIRSTSLPSTDFRSPDQVLASLNEAFPMREHNNMFFTAWYGVFHRPSHTLRFAGGGHPPALLVGSSGVQELESAGSLLGVKPGSTFPCTSISVPPRSRLYLFSDGVYEIYLPNGRLWNYAEFTSMMGRPPEHGRSPIERLYQTVRSLRGIDALDDDFSIMELSFP